MTENVQYDYAALMKQALLKLRQAEARIRDLTEAAHEPVAVVGMACRFPGAPDLAAFERVLDEGIDAIREVPEDRWSLNTWYHPDPNHPGTMAIKHGGFVDGVDLFDPRFFGISAHEARNMDPQQRMLLEVGWHALEDAGLTRPQLQAGRTGVYIGISTNDYGQLIQSGPLENLDPFVGTGNALSVAAGRLAYFLDLNGPCLALDTACSSSLVAIHLAVRSLRDKECRVALAGGVNLLLNPIFTLNFARAGMLAPDGRCKAFDDSANGYVRAEGCGILVLKRLTDATADGDRIHALIRGSAINTDGRSSGLTVPSGAAQQDVIRRALADAGMEPHEIGYVEAHGTGTALGDPIELASLQAVYGDDAKRRRPLLTGSVKSNIGHAESAAGVAGIIKTILSVKSRKVYQSLHYRRLNSHVEPTRLNVRVVEHAQPWPEEPGRACAGVSSFGFSGTNAHVLVEAAPAQPPAAVPAPPRHGWTLTISARCPDALRDLAQMYAERIPDDPNDLTRLCAAARHRRERFIQRLDITAGSPARLKSMLEQFAQGSETAHGESPASDADGLEKTWAELPLYPFRRERSWVGHGWNGRTAAPSKDLYELVWQPQRSSDPSLIQEHSEYLPQFLNALEGLAVRYAREALDRLGPEAQVIPKYKLLLRRLYAIAEQTPCAEEPEDSPERRLLDRCGPKLHRVLQGRQDPIELLFPNGDVTALVEIYHDSAAAKFMNSLLERVVSQVAQSVVGRPRILEAGAGTGSATSRLLAALENRQPEYWFTDISPAFLEQARDTFARFAFVRYGVLDLDQEPQRQGIPARHFDIVIAANVVHATQHLEQTILRLRELLKPGGTLVLQEGLAPLAWVDLTFGLSDGWWAFRDYDLRPDYPLIGREQWLDLLERCGLEEASVSDGGRDFRQAIILAKAPAISGAIVADSPVNTHDRAEIEESLRACSAPARSVQRSLTPVTQSRTAHLIFTDYRVAHHRIPVDDGSTVVRCQPGASLREVARDEWVLDPRDRRQVSDLIDCTGSVHTITHLLGLEAAAAGDQDLALHQEWLCGSVLNIVQSLRGRPSRLLLFTKDAQHVVDADRTLGFAHAPLWGLGKVIGLEHPEIAVRLVDVDDAATALEVEWRIHDREQLVAWRGNTRFVARLRERPEPARRSVQAAGGGCYLIAGGLGGLGLAVTGWLVQQGAGEVLMLGRRPPDVIAEQSIAQLRRRGARVLALQCDITKPEDLAQALAQSTLPLRGIVHAAGALDDGLIDQLHWSRFDTVMKPKISGLWNLHQLSLERPLEWFVIFSSAVGLLGNAGQANHAAASAFAQSFAYFRRASGLPALCIDWGAWDQVGAAARQRADSGLRMPGIRPIQPDRSLALMGALLAEQTVHAAVVDVDWAGFRTCLPEGSAPPHLCEVLPQEAPRVEMAAPVDVSDVFGYLTEQVARLLGFAAQEVDPRLGLSELGVDSLMAVRLRNRVQTDLKVEIPVAAFMENQSIRQLAAMLREQDEVVEGVL